MRGLKTRLPHTSSALGLNGGSVSWIRAVSLKSVCLEFSTPFGMICNVPHKFSWSLNMLNTDLRHSLAALGIYISLTISTSTGHLLKPVIGYSLTLIPNKVLHC
jgi:hypothetical protein